MLAERVEVAVDRNQKATQDQSCNTILEVSWAFNNHLPSAQPDAITYHLCPFGL